MFLVIALFVTSCSKKTHRQTEGTDYPKRIISLSPGITEIAFAIGLDEEIVGVTTFCKYPRKARTRTRVGGFMNLNYETVIGLDPDLVIATTYHEETVAQLENLGIKSLVVEKNDSIDLILKSVKAIGGAVGRRREAENLVADIESKLEKAKAENKGKIAYRTMLVVGRNPGTMQGLFVAGKTTFLNELLEIAGGKNIFHDISNDFPQPTLEQIISRNPEVIIETRIGKKLSSEEIEAIKEEWNALGDVDAVRNGRIYIWTEKYLSIPGPRLVRILNKFNQTLYGEN